MGNLGYTLRSYGSRLDADGRAGVGVDGVVPLATAVIGVCPAYLPFGITTCGKK